jgi:6-pyruvoyltetrahydropterin/6-carboxytetrahydropterin synthase
MKQRITKEFSFDAGHRLAKDYRGKCQYPHGHHYVVEVTIESEVLDRLDMVIDFNELKFIGTYLDKTFDHKMILYRQDPFLHFYRDAIEGFGLKASEAICLLEGNPTAEFMASKIYIDILKVLPPEFDLISVVVYETPTSRAEVRNG